VNPQLFSFLRVFFVVFAMAIGAGCKTSKGPVVAKVGNSTITVADLQSRLQDTPPAYQHYATTPEGRRQFLNLLVRESLLLEESKKSGLPKDENYKKAVARFKEKSERDFKEYQDSLLIEMGLAKLRSKDLAVTDPEIRAYYDQNLNDFTHPVEIQASHILLNNQEDADKALARIKKGESFESVARTASMDPPTAARGGKLAPFTKGSLMPEFENAVVPLKDGQVSEPIKSPFGYHIIKKLGQRSLPAQSFEQAKEDIKVRLQREKFDKWVAQSQASLGVNINEKELASVTLQPVPSMPPGMPGAAPVRQESVQ
jgi:peptidyl-prolyl cis-trans isomerase C